MFREILRKRFWTLVLFLVALGGVATALFALDDVRREQSASWDWEILWRPSFFTPTAHAESGVRVRVEVPEATFADELISVSPSPCTITDAAGRTQKYPGRSAMCVFDEASRTAGFTYDIVLYGYQGLITRLARSGVEAQTLIWFVINNEFPGSGDCHPMYGVSITTCPVKDGDELLIFSNDDSAYPPLALTLGDDEVLINERVQVNVTDARTGGAVGGASVWFGGEEARTDANGEAVFSSRTAQAFEIYVEKDEYIRSRHLPLDVQDVPAVDVTVEERTDFEKNRNIGVTTTMLGEIFLDHATVLGAIVLYCEEEAYACRVNDAGVLLEFRGMSDVVVTKNDVAVLDLLESVSAGARVRVALPVKDEPEPSDDTPLPPLPPTPPSEPPSNDAPPPTPLAPRPDSTSPTDDTPEQNDSVSDFDSTPAISPTTSPISTPPAHGGEPDRDDGIMNESKRENEEDGTSEEEAQTSREMRASQNVNVNAGVASAIPVIQAVPQKQEELQRTEETQEQRDASVVLQSEFPKSGGQEERDDRTPLVRGLSVNKTDAVWLIVLLLASSCVACVTGIRLLRCVASSGRSA